ncbi:MAG: amidohydrolase [Clostridia bacterium]|nr:amidohydrolase [Clostridia bacterium]
MKTLNMTPTMIIHGGSIYTADKDDSICEAIAVCGDKILATGTNEEILALAGPDTEIVDLQGRTAMPGINDSHAHLWQAGMVIKGMVLFGIDSIEELKKQLAEKVKTCKPGELIFGASYIESQFKENRTFTKAELDEAAPDNPVIFDRVFGVCVANSKALEIAGITKDTPDPEKGHIVKDPVTGEPNGVLEGDAMVLVKAAMEEPCGPGYIKKDADIAFYEGNIYTGLKEFNSYGITSTTEAGMPRGVMRAYHRICDRGELTMRVAMMPDWYGFNFVQDWDDLAGRIDEYDYATGYGNEMIRYTGLKMAIDYGMTSKTALKSWAYVGDDGPRQVPLRLDLDKLDGYIKTAHDAGWDIGIHVMGDIACDRAVDAIYKAVKANPRKHRHSVIHAYYVTDEARAKMAEVGILHIAQGSFIYGEADGYPDLLPEDKMHSYNPLRTLKDAGIVIGLSTDMPCGALNPFWNMYSCVTRKAMRGTSIGTEECITVTEAVKMMTYNGAVLSYEEDIKGSLEPGKLADIAILDRSLVDIDPEDIRNIKVMRTILGGKTVFER